MKHLMTFLILQIGCVSFEQPTFYREPQPNFEEAYIQIKGKSLEKDQKYASFKEYRTAIEDVMSSESVLAGRKVRVSAPKEYQGKLPLIISLHGMGGNPIYQNYFFNATRYTGTMQFVLAIPPGLRKEWDFTHDRSRDREFILQLIKELKVKYPIEATRIYLVGHSNGAIFGLNLVCKTTTFAAVVSIGGLANFDDKKCLKAPTNVIFIHGLNDTIVKYAYGRYSFRKMGVYNGCDPANIYKNELTLGGMPGTFEKYANCANNANTMFYTLNSQNHTDPLSSKVVETILLNILQLQL